MILISSFFDVFCVFFQGKVGTSCNLDTTDYFVLYSFILIIQNPLLRYPLYRKRGFTENVRFS